MIRVKIFLCEIETDHASIGFRVAAQYINVPLSPNRVAKSQAPSLGFDLNLIEILEQERSFCILRNTPDFLFRAT